MADEYANTVRNAVDLLNKAIHAAYESGLEVRVEVEPLQKISRVDPKPIVTTRVLRPV